MKITELRIGNYVEYDKDILQISAIIPPKEKESTYRVWFNNDSRAKLIRDIKPIPLTEDWLKKFGFEKKAEYIWIKEIFKGMFDIKIILIEKGKYVPVIMSMGEEVAIRQKQYVHQLQNLYFELIEVHLKKLPEGQKKL